MNATDMTKGKPMKLLFLFSLPLMFGNVFQQLYTVVDTMIVGQTLRCFCIGSTGRSRGSRLDEPWKYSGIDAGIFHSHGTAVWSEG